MEFFRFCVVGVICTLLDLLVYNLLQTMLPYQLCAVIGFVVSYILNYLLTAYWTFKATPTRGNFIGMLCVHLLNLFVVRVGLLTFFVEKVGMGSRIAYIPTLVLSATASFLLIRLLFRPSRKKRL